MGFTGLSEIGGKDVRYSECLLVMGGLGIVFGVILSFAE